MRFVDTNLILYAISSNPNDQERKRVAYDILLAPDLAFSTQVFQEFTCRRPGSRVTTVCRIGKP